MWTILLQLYSVLAPYLTPVNIAAVEAAVEKAVTDYRGGNYAEVLADLAAALKVILPGAAAKIDRALSA